MSNKVLRKTCAPNLSYFKLYFVANAFALEWSSLLAGDEGWIAPKQKAVVFMLRPTNLCNTSMA